VYVEVCGNSSPRLKAGAPLPLFGGIEGDKEKVRAYTELLLEKIADDPEETRFVYYVRAILDGRNRKRTIHIPEDDLPIFRSPYDDTQSSKLFPENALKRFNDQERA